MLGVVRVAVILLFWETTKLCKADVLCGDYFYASTRSDNGLITSPSLPDSIKCIWMLEAKKGLLFQLTIQNISSHNCLEVREGSQTQPLLDTFDTDVATSSERWMWIKFTRDASRLNASFSAVWKVISHAGDSNATSPITDCQSKTFRCRNYECISWAYRCDQDNDCGCTGYGCDEDSCEGTGLSRLTMVGIGIGVGVFTTVFLFVFVILLDMYIKRRSEAQYQQRMAEHKMRVKKQKSKPVDLVMVETEAGMMVDLVSVADSSRRSSRSIHDKPPVAANLKTSSNNSKTPIADKSLTNPKTK